MRRGTKEPSHLEISHSVVHLVQKSRNNLRETIKQKAISSNGL